MNTTLIALGSGIATLVMLGVIAVAMCGLQCSSHVVCLYAAAIRFLHRFNRCSRQGSQMSITYSVRWFNPSDV
jgi:hypothetical protein